MDGFVSIEQIKNTKKQLEQEKQEMEWNLLRLQGAIAMLSDLIVVGERVDEAQDEPAIQDPGDQD